MTDELTLKVLDTLKHRIDWEEVASILGMTVKVCDWMEPDECVLLGSETLVYVKGDRMTVFPIKKFRKL